MQSPTSIFACEGVCLSLGGRQILSDVGLHVSRGEVLGLIGPNGAGKTSLFEVLSGRYVAQQGRVTLDGQDVTRLDIVRRSRLGLARTYQSPVVPSALTVGETFRAARMAYRPFLSRHRAEWAARLVNLTVPWSRPSGSLDTFDRRKLLLACLLMRRPKVLLMDEPASGLINTEIDELDLLLRTLVDEYHLAVIVIEHRLELLEALADRVTVLNLGEVIAEGTPEGVFKDPAVRAAYFEGGWLMSAILQISDLSAGYGPLRVLHEINFTVERGERLAIVGLNGHGKTTLFRAITHLVGWQRGSILFDGIEIGGQRSLGEGRRTPGIVRLGVAMTPQGDAIFPGLTVRQHLDCGAWSRNAWRERAKRREMIFDLFPPLRKLENTTVGTLSGGERRMVSVGRALMTEARLYLIDEPSLGLAPVISQRVVAALREIDVRDGAIVIAEQNVSLLDGQVDRMIGMHAGRLRGDVGHVELG